MKDYKRMDVERSFLGHIMFDNKKLDGIRFLKPNHFSDERNQRLFNAALKLRGEDRVIDYASLFEETKIDARYIASLIGTDSFDFLEETLLESYIRQQVQGLANKIMSKDLEKTDVFEELENMITVMEGFNDMPKVYGKTKILEEIIDEIILYRDSENRNLLKFESLPSVNKYVGGINDTDLTGIYGKEKSTKTTFAFRMALDVVAQGKSAAIFEYEIDEKEMYQKVLSMLTGITQTKIRNPKGFGPETRLSDAELEELKQKANILKNQNLHLFAAQQSELDIQNICRSLKKDGLDLIVIDYLLLIETYKTYSSYRERINDLTRFFKLMANRLHVPIVLISQSNESGERAAEGKGLERDSNYFFYIESANDFKKHVAKTLDFYDESYGKYTYEFQPDDYVVQLRRIRHSKGGKYFVVGYSGGQYHERETRPLKDVLFPEQYNDEFPF